MQKRFFFLVTLMLVLATNMMAQITTSALSGRVTMVGSDETIIGATVQAVHEPSGTRYTAVSNIDGLFNIQGMRSGGPYKVIVSYIGFQTKSIGGVYLQLGETYNLEVWLNENANELAEVLVTGRASKFAVEKTGASTNITNAQITNLPTVTRSINDVTRLSPYGGNGMSFAGSDGRLANFNNNFGLSSNLPGGGNPISLDAIEELQVVISPYDVRQTNFIGGGVNAITKSGTNTFRGSAYLYHTNENMRGDAIEREQIAGVREKDQNTTYGFTLGGPIIKNKLFFFVNGEMTKTPTVVNRWRGSENGVADPDNYLSRTTLSDLEKVSRFVHDKYGYDTGSYTNFPADENNYKLLARLDWNISDKHHLALRYNYTKNRYWSSPNATSMDGGTRMVDARMSKSSMSYANSMYAMDNLVHSLSFDLNSRLTESLSNQFLATYSKLDDVRASDSAPFPFIDILQDGNNYIALGYELFTWNNAVHNTIWNMKDDVTWYAGKHKVMGGISFEHQMADNQYMRNGTGYYRYTSLDDFLNGADPEVVCMTYGYNGEEKPAARVQFNKLGVYAQDEWTFNKKFKLTYGLRLDGLFFNNSDLMTNAKILALDYFDNDGKVRHIDTGKWPDTFWQFSPRVGFTWDVFGDKSLKIRGGSGLFQGHFPLVYFTNMPGNANVFQLNYVAGYSDGNKAYADGLGRDPVYVENKIQGLAGRLLGMEELREYFEVPKTNERHVADQNITGVSSDFKMPMVWKSSIAVDYQLPVSFPFTVTGEFIYNQMINAVYMDNINVKDDHPENMAHFNGADDRVKFSNSDLYYTGKYAVMLKNIHKGYGYTASIQMNAEPIKNLKLMAAYTKTESKEVSGLPGQNAVSTWTSTITVDGPNSTRMHRSNYVTPDQVIASLDYFIPYRVFGTDWGTRINVFYKAYSASNGSYLYTSDFNGDGVNNDLIYIPANDGEIQFKTEADRIAFWRFVEQDDYLNSHRGEYAEAYAARAPWLHRFDIRIAQDFQVKVGATKHKLQLTADIINFGNMLNSKWGIPQNAQISNYGKILKYEGVDDSNKPVFSMYKVNGEYPTKTYDTNMSYSNCWKLQLGIKYFFN